MELTHEEQILSDKIGESLRPIIKEAIKNNINVKTFCYLCFTSAEFNYIIENWDNE